MPAPEITAVDFQSMLEKNIAILTFRSWRAPGTPLGTPHLNIEPRAELGKLNTNRPAAARVECWRALARPHRSARATVREGGAPRTQKREDVVAPCYDSSCTLSDFVIRSTEHSRLHKSSPSSQLDTTLRVCPASRSPTSPAGR
jgi:hypothetical protein